MARLSLILYLVLTTAGALCTLPPANIAFQTSGLDVANKCDQIWWPNETMWQAWSEKQCEKAHKRSSYGSMNITDNGHSYSGCESNVGWSTHEMEKKDSWEKQQKKCKKKSNKKQSHRHHASSSNKKKKWKPYAMSMWYKWQKFSDCRCESVKFHPMNPAGVTVCYQTAFFNKKSGLFSGEITVHRPDPGSQNMKLEFKYDNDVKIFNTKKITLSSNGWYKGSKPAYKWKRAMLSNVEKHFVVGQLPQSEISSNSSLNPTKFKLVNDNSGNESTLIENKDYVILPTSKFVASEPFSPAMTPPASSPPSSNGTPPPPTGNSGDGTASLPPAGSGGDGTASPTPPPAGNGGDGTASPPPPPAGNGGDGTASPPPPPAGNGGDGTASPPPPPAGNGGNNTTPSSTAGGDSGNNATSSTPNQQPTGTDSGNSGTSQSNSNPGGNIGNNTTGGGVGNGANSKAANSNTTSLPGQNFGVLPIGLMIFGGLIGLGGVIIVYNTLKRRKCRKEFERQQRIQREETANRTNGLVSGFDD